MIASKQNELACFYTTTAYKTNSTAVQYFTRPKKWLLQANNPVKLLFEKGEVIKGDREVIHMFVHLEVMDGVVRSTLDVDPLHLDVIHLGRQGVQVDLWLEVLVVQVEEVQ